MGDTLDYTALAAEAERTANAAESRHLAALWLELAQTYRELAVYHRAVADFANGVSGLRPVIGAEERPGGPASKYP